MQKNVKPTVAEQTAFSQNPMRPPALSIFADLVKDAGREVAIIVLRNRAKYGLQLEAPG